MQDAEDELLLETIDMTVNAFGIELSDDRFEPIIRVGTYYPMASAVHMGIRVPPRDQPNLTIQVYEGKDSIARRSGFYGSIVIDTSGDYPEGIPIQVGFRLTRSRSLEISVQMNPPEDEKKRFTLRRLTEDLT